MESILSFLESLWKYTGLLCWILLIAWLLLRAIYGKNWMLRVGMKTVVGTGLMTASKKLLQEVEQKNPQKETLVEVAVQVFWRLTRIGIFAVVIAFIPFILLFQQNQLIQKQNDLFAFQNKKIIQQTELDSTQTVLLTSQNAKLDTQNNLFVRQNDLFLDQNINVEEQTKLFKSQNSLLIDQNKLVGGQNDLITDQNIKFDAQTDLLRQQTGLFKSQNAKIDTQNIRLNIQNNLMEADRRSSLIFLMSNVLDLVDTEIQAQRGKQDSLGRPLESIGYHLSKGLLGRIIALSRAFRPYRMMEGDTLSADLVSPERGQLFIALMENGLDSATQNTIVEKGDFSNAIIGEINLTNANLRRANLREADLREADLIGANLRFADLRGADLRGANLFRADLRVAKLIGAKLIGANLFRADLHFANLREANLREANLREANLRETDLREANLRETDLRVAKLFGADLSEADLFGADLFGANLFGANLSEADLSGADLSGAGLLNIKSDNLFNQLKEARSLYGCENLDPSIQAQLEEAKPCLFTKEGCPVK